MAIVQDFSRWYRGVPAPFGQAAAFVVLGGGDDEEPEAPKDHLVSPWAGVVVGGGVSPYAGVVVSTPGPCPWAGIVVR